jgi:hypothetical protein
VHLVSRRPRTRQGTRYDRSHGFGSAGSDACASSWGCWTRGSGSSECLWASRDLLDGVSSSHLERGADAAGSERLVSALALSGLGCHGSRIPARSAPRRPHPAHVPSSARVAASWMHFGSRAFAMPTSGRRREATIGGKPSSRRAPAPGALTGEGEPDPGWRVPFRFVSRARPTASLVRSSPGSSGRLSHRRHIANVTICSTAGREPRARQATGGTLMLSRRRRPHPGHTTARSPRSARARPGHYPLQAWGAQSTCRQRVKKLRAGLQHV